MNRLGLRQRTLTALVGGLWAAALLAALVAPGGVSAASQEEAITGYPNAMASTGDSITRAFNTGPIAFLDAPSNSWSTGTTGSVNSHYSRILAANPAISGRNYNDAVTGAQIIDLDAQVTTATGRGVDYITILLGANDACTDTEALMTSVADYRSRFKTALNTIASRAPNARIYVASVPNVYNLWYIFRDNSTAHFTWSVYGICESLLANPTSNQQADIDRRNRVRQRVVDYNTQLAELCATNIHCRFDNNAVFNTTFLTTDVSTRDYFHPAVSGQAKLATVSYGATYDFTDNIAPVSTHSITLAKHATYITLSATNNVGAVGIEYKIGTGAYTRYTGPVRLDAGSTITYRAVDVNGNSEATHSYTAP